MKDSFSTDRDRVSVCEQRRGASLPRSGL